MRFQRTHTALIAILLLQVPTVALPQSRADDGALAQTGDGTLVGTGAESPVNVEGTQYTVGDHSIVGYTIEQHERALRERERQIRAEQQELLRTKQELSERERLELAAEIESLIAEHEQAEHELLNLRQSHETRVAELAKARTELAEVGANISQERIEEAMAALDNGETGLADTLFAQVAEREKGHIDRAAEAFFQRGVIAEGRFDWKAAAEHYTRAADVLPSYDRLEKAAEFAGRNVRRDEAVHYGERLVAISTDVLGPQHEKTADAISALAKYYGEAARYREAEQAHLDVLAATEGQETAARARHLSGYGQWLVTLGRLREAEQTLREAITIAGDEVGGDRHTWHTFLAHVLNELGQYVEADNELERAAEILAQSESYGTRHPDYLDVQKQKAVNLFDKGQSDEAITLMRAVLAQAKPIYGAEHPALADYYNGLVYVLQNKDAAASEEAVENALRLTRQALGPLHPEYALELGNLALFEHRQGGYAEAEEKYLEAARILAETLGKRHPWYLGVSNNLATLLSETGRVDESIVRYREIQAIRSEVQGKLDINYTMGLINLALTLKTRGQFEEARGLVEEALELVETVVGQDHRNWAMAQSALAQIATESGDYEAGEQAAKLALEANEKLFGPTSLRNAIALNDLAGLRFQQGRFAEAIPDFLASLKIMREGGHEMHAVFPQMQSNLGAAYVKLRDFERAIPVLQDAVETVRSRFGQRNVMALVNLGYAFSENGLLAEAEESLLSAISILEGSASEDTPAYYWAVANLANVYDQLGQSDIALRYARTAHDRFAQVFGKDHPNYARAAGNLAAMLTGPEHRAEERALYEGALDAAKRHIDPSREAYALAHLNLAIHLAEDDEFERAKSLMDEAIRRFESAAVVDPRHLANAYDHAGWLAEKQGNPEDAVPFFRKALKVRREHFAPDDPTLHSSILRTAARLPFEEKEALLRELLDPAKTPLDTLDPVRIRAMNNLAIALNRRGQKKEAIEILRKVLAIDMVAEREGTEEHITHLENLAFFLDRSHRLDEAESLYRQAIEFERALPGGDGTASWSNLGQLALILSKTGRDEEAIALFEDALAAELDRRNGRKTAPYIELLENYGNFLSGTDREADAIAHLEEAADLRLRRDGPRDRDYLEALLNLGLVQTNAEAFDAAASTLRKALSYVETAVGEADELYGRAHYFHGRLHARANRDETAEAALRASIDANGRVGKAGEDHIANSQKYLAIVLERKGELEAAEAHFAQAFETLRDLHGIENGLTIDAADKYAAFLEKHRPEQQVIQDLRLVAAAKE